MSGVGWRLAVQTSPDDEQFPTLRHLLGAYFHQDWEADDPDDDAVVRRFIRDDGPAVGVRLTVELRALLDAGLPDAELERWLRGCGCYFYPPGVGLAYSAWLRRVLDLVEGSGSRRGKAESTGDGMPP